MRPAIACRDEAQFAAEHKPKRLIHFELGLGGVQSAYTYEITISVDGNPMVVEAVFAPSDQIILGIDGMQLCRLVIDFPAASVELVYAGP